MKKHKYIENVLVKLKRIYSKDEYVNHLLVKNKKQKDEIKNLKTLLESIQEKTRRQKEEIARLHVKIEHVNIDFKNTKKYIELKDIIKANHKTIRSKNKLIEALNK